ncbi:hypothetical protein [Acidiphilium acidophilum]|uniref:hypothetical protein n=1 Tax=Acidiphilium acidophilum TaxID=76588 RepID=UPI002E8E77BC|nr:hypothetical protein [Acidiphilium acidophilum]
MSSTTVTVGNNPTVGSYTQITASGTYDVVVQGASGILFTTGSLDTTILTITEQGFLFTDEVSGGATELFNPTTLNGVIPFLDLGYAPGGSIEPGGGTLILGNNLASKRGKNVGDRSFFPCTDSAQGSLWVMCLRRSPFPR